MSLAVAGLYGSYLVVLGLLLYRRCTNGIRSYLDTELSITNTAGTGLCWGPWRIPGRWGILVNVFSCAYLTTVFFFTFWPTSLPVDAASMNYNCVLLGGVMILSIAYYCIWGKKDYKGPRIEITLDDTNNLEFVNK